LYEHAVAAGCGGMVHVSSVAALGSTTSPGKPAGDDQTPAPDTAYGHSKLMGDRALDGARVPGTRLCILRPPLLFGRDAGGLFGLLKKAALKGVPLPLAGIDAKRSVMHVDNLGAAVLAAIRSGIDGTFVVADTPAIQPAALYRKMLHHSGFEDRCFSIGHGGRAVLARLLGKRRANSLLSDSWFDGSRFASVTACVYPLDADAAIADAMRR
jgi:UDP-glucose 4-epimerase